ncbi:MAG TPA: response regulator transcription factor [Patescibacteria group bacterium]
MRILIIEDDRTLATSLQEQLSEVYKVDIAHTGARGQRQAEVTAYDLILLDLDLPDIHGKDVCFELRKKGIKAPVLIVTGEADIEIKTSCLDAGADDYITKPFHSQELFARIRALLRRNPDTALSNHLRVKDLELDPATRIATRQGKTIPLRRKEFDILEYLMRNPNRVLTRDMILEYVWGDTSEPFTNSISVHIKHLRDKIDYPFEPKLIQTVHSLGYKIQG